MTCNEVADFLDDYLSGELPHVQREAFDLHIGACQTCRRYLDTYRQTMSLARSAEAGVAQDVPEELVDAIVASIGWR